MRLKQFEIEAIKKSVAFFDPDAEIRLFGSRIDDKAKGGDIDILIFSDKLEKIDGYKIRTKLFNLIEEQKVDILIRKEKNDPFVEHIMHSSVII